MKESFEYFKSLSTKEKVEAVGCAMGVVTFVVVSYFAMWIFY